MAKKRYIQAINEALFEEMERDPRVVIFGEDIEISMFGDTRNLKDKFGDRVRNTPISEAAMSGMAVGAAAAGHRVIFHMMFSNFTYTGFDAIANQMAKMRLMTGGQATLPITVMAGYGGGGSNAAQHSDTPHPLFMNLGGLNVAVPAMPADAKGLLKSAIRGDNPTIFLEAVGRGGERGEVPEGDHTTPFGQANILREGGDVTIFAVGSMVRTALEGAEALAERGIEAEVIDPRTLVPLDEEAVLTSVKKTGHLVAVDEARDRCGAASHMAGVVADRGFGSLKGPVKRVTVPDTSIPYAPNAEGNIRPNAEKVVAAALAALGK